MKVEVIDTWIPMSDGTRLGARIWMPETVGSEALPVILEYIPYRKDDFTAIRDSSTIAWFADQGYVSVRVDIRGSGSSDGVLFDEYSEIEVSDGTEIIEWLANQQWCDGNVGMIGISWGGISGLLQASRNPEALKTVIAIGATEFRYYDDACYYMGCMIGQTIGWAAIMYGYNTRPPDPELIGDGWRDLWLKRIRSAPHYLVHWLEHQREDDYWRERSVGAEYSAIKIPVYAVSGHADCWPNTVARLLENLQSPTRGLQGAWCHRYPHLGIPGPQIGFLQDAKRWFDEWLKNESTGIMDEDAYQVYMQDSVPPKKFYENRPGKWVSEPSWPSPYVEVEPLFLGDGILTKSKPNPVELEISSPQTVGLESGEYMPWFAFGVSDELPGDQQVEDRGSLCFETNALENPLEILGNPELEITLKCDQSVALLAVRLCDVHPNGESTLITRGLLNLCQRNSKSSPEKLAPDKSYSVQVTMNHTGYVVPEGHRLRLAISTSYWPIAWPTPYVTKITAVTELSLLNLPVRIEKEHKEKQTQFLPPETGKEMASTKLREFDEKRTLEVNPATSLHQLKIYTDNGKFRFSNNGIEMSSKCWQTYSIHPDDPLSAKAEYEWEWEFSRGDDWRVKTFTQTRLHSDENDFHLEYSVVAWEKEDEIYRASTYEKFARDHF